MLGIQKDQNGLLWHLPSTNVRSSPFPFLFRPPFQSFTFTLLLYKTTAAYLVATSLSNTFPPNHSSPMQLSNTTPNSLLFSTQNILRLPIHYPLGSKGRAVPRVVCCAIPIARAAGKVLVVTSRKQPNNWLCNSFLSLYHNCV